MKKLLVVSIVALAALCGQAASLDWGADWAYSKNTDKGVDTYDDPGAMTYWVVALSGSSTDGISVDGDGNIVLGTATQAATGSGTASLGGTVLDLTEADNGKYYALVIYDAANGLYGISEAVALTGIKDSPPQNADYVSFSNDGGANADSTPYMMANLAIPSEGAPEPTSGLLLLIGGSLLALRRKQK